VILNAGHCILAEESYHPGRHESSETQLCATQKLVFPTYVPAFHRNDLNTSYLKQ